MEQAFAEQELSSSSTSSSSESEISDSGGRHGHKGKHGGRGGHFHSHGKHKGKCGHRHKSKFGHLHTPTFPWVSVQSGIAPGFSRPHFPHPMGGPGPRGPPHHFPPPHGPQPHFPPPPGPPPHGPPHHHGHRGPPGHPHHGGPGHRGHCGGMRPFAPPREGPPGHGLSVDITATKEQYTMLGEATGFEKSNVEVTVSDSVLTIKGELPKKDDNGACARTLVEECCYPTKFHRSFKLPADVQLDKVKAEVKHGLLHVVLPRKPGPEPTVIPVGGTDGEEGFVSVAERAS